jgi:hypothetical protein
MKWLSLFSVDNTWTDAFRKQLASSKNPFTFMPVKTAVLHIAAAQVVKNHR